MKIIYYCQQIWGVGHLFRSLEIIRALKDHQVYLVLGGPPVEVALPPGVVLVQLPGIMTDRNYNGLHPVEGGVSLKEIKAKRRRQLAALFADQRPDYFLVELFPFGRRAFRFELDPILEDIRQNGRRRCRVVCSLRDILVGKKDAEAFEKDVVQRLNRYFDGLLIHADPKVQELKETFGRIKEMKIPFSYTGFVAPKPPPGASGDMRRRLKLADDDILVVASAGGGKMAATHLPPVAEAFRRLKGSRRRHLYLFTGPFMPDAEYQELAGASGNGIHVQRFSEDFLALMMAADLSISMAGYNTCMNLLTTHVPALVWPFPGDREQGMRARKLAALDVLQVLTSEDLAPDRLADLMATQLEKGPPPAAAVNLDGADNTRLWLEKWRYRFKC